MGNLAVSEAGFGYTERDTAELAEQYDGNLIVLDNNVPGHPGARYCPDNLIEIPDDFTDPGWTVFELGDGVVTISGDGKSAQCITSGSGRAFLEYTVAAPKVVGDQPRLMAKFESISGTPTQRNLSMTGSLPVLTLPASATDGDYITPVVTETASGSYVLRIGVGTSSTETGGLSLTVSAPVLFLVTAHSNKNPDPPEDRGTWVRYQNASYIKSTGEVVFLRGCDIDRRKDFDGVDDYVSIPMWETANGAYIEFTYQEPVTEAGTNRYLFDSDSLIVSERNLLAITPSNVFSTLSGTVYVDGAISASYPVDGQPHRIRVEYSVTGRNTQRIGQYAGGGATFANGGSISDMVMVDGTSSADRHYKLDELTGTTAVDSISGQDGTYINMSAPLPLLPPVMKGLLVYGFDWLNRAAHATEIESPHYSISASITPTKNSLIVGGLPYTRLSRASGSTAHFINPAGAQPSAGVNSWEIYLLAGSSAANDKLAGLCFYDYTAAATVDTTVEIRKGPGVIDSGTSGATIKTISGLSETIPTVVRLKENSAAVAGNDVRPRLYLNQSNSGDSVIYATGWSWGEGHLPRTVLSSGTPAIGEGALVQKAIGPIANGVSAVAEVTMLFSSDDEVGNATVIHFQGETSTDEFFVYWYDPNNKFVLAKKNTGRSIAQIIPGTTDSFAYGEKRKFKFSASPDGMTFSIDDVEQTPLSSADAQADWSSDLDTVTLGMKDNGTEGGAFIFEDVRIYHGGLLVMTLDYSADVGHLQAIPSISDNDTIEYDPWLYEANGTDVHSYTDIVTPNPDGSICVPSTVPEGTYLWKNVRAKVSGVWSQLKDYFVVVKDAPDSYISEKSPIIVTKRTDGRWLSG